MRPAPTIGRLSVAVVYGASLFQGMTVVAFPASSTVLRAMHGLSDEAYGSLFLPQTLLTIVGSLLGGALARKIGLRALLVAAACAGLLSQLALLSVVALPSSAALPVLLVGTGLMGLGFGGAAAPLNTYPGLFFPSRGDSALVALHTVLGAGFSLGPIAVSALIASGRWAVFPIVVAVGNLLVAWASSGVLLPVPRCADSTHLVSKPAWGSLLVLSVIAVLYAFAEGTFSNWASIYLHEARAVDEPVAALAISGFWAALTLGRLAAAALVTRIAPFKVWLALPLAMVAVFLLLPHAQHAGDGVALFCAAGLASSAFFPLTVAIANKRYPGREAAVSSLLTAALMVGVGGGSFALGALRNQLSFDAIYRLSALYPFLAFALGALTATTNPSIRTRRELTPERSV
jgi:fucose permease